MSLNKIFPQELYEVLIRLMLLGKEELVEFKRLTGGVSSDIWLVDIQGDKPRKLCIKCALPKLKVAADWQAPIERSRYEMQWMKIVAGIDAHATPEILGFDHDKMVLVMSYLDPKYYTSWKEALRCGNVDSLIASQLGNRLVNIHKATTNKKAIAAQFPDRHIFHALRIAPYLEATALIHTDLKSRLLEIAQATFARETCLIHGDVSPKNILNGPQGPVLVDAECACIGDPAFDVAFCLNHLLLKCLWAPASAHAYLDCFDALIKAYLSRVSWIDKTEIEIHIASLLPALMLARVDGNSPVEYLVTDTDKEQVRGCAKALLTERVDKLDTIKSAWKDRLKLC